MEVKCHSKISFESRKTARLLYARNLLALGRADENQDDYAENDIRTA